MQPTEAEILAALTRYRERVVQHNRDAFVKFVEMAETAQTTDPQTPDHLVAAGRLNFIYRLLNVSHPELHHDPNERIETPADILTKWTALVRIFNLDGVIDSKDGEMRERDRIEFKQSMMTELLRVCDGDNGGGEDMADLQKFPNDFWILMSQVDSLIGHGWPQYHEEGQQVTLWHGLDYSQTTLVDPDNLELYGWEVLTGWEIGNGPETACYVLYCRSEEGEEGVYDDGDKDTNWQWRYVIDGGQNGIEAFDNVVDLLEWYEELNLPDLEHLGWYTRQVFNN
ncbi:hypothetical protein PG985_004322 [Apiospora marii]|uniref:Knr4/Smi1-like domain-containing protein n=1 Tax=Apiospora marii TaxID=335849 RepID=A0ABR1S9C6_9PEZI